MSTPETDLDETPDTLVEEEVAPETDDHLNAMQMPAAGPVPLDVRNIDLDQIGERSNIRKTHGIRSMADSMHINGQLQPCVVRPAPEGSEHGRPFEMVFGHRRLRAAELLEWETVRCEVRDIPDDQRLQQMIVENYQREDLSAIEEAYTMLALEREQGMTRAQISRALGCDPSHVTHRLSLLKLATPPRPVREPLPALPAAQETTDPDPVQEDAGEEAEQESSPAPALPAVVVEEEVEEDDRLDIINLIDQGKLSASAAEVIASLDSREQQEKVAGLAAKYSWSVKQVEKYAGKLKVNESVEGPDAMGPVEMLQMGDAVPLQRVALRPDLTPDDLQRLNLFALLRNGMDKEMLDYLQDQMGFGYDFLWHYIEQLSEEQVTQFLELMLRRYASAAHRFHDWPAEFVDRFSLPPDTEGEMAEQALQAANQALPEAMGY